MQAFLTGTVTGRAGLIPILQAIQHEYQYLPEEVLNFVATSLDVPPARVFGVATFYAHFALEPKGKHVIRICDGTACHVKQSLPILSAIHEKLGTSEKQKTSSDALFTVETVACLGACGLAPVVVIDEQVYGAMTPERAVSSGGRDQDARDRRRFAGSRGVGKWRISCPLAMVW